MWNVFFINATIDVIQRREKLQVQLITVFDRIYNSLLPDVIGNSVKYQVIFLILLKLVQLFLKLVDSCRIKHISIFDSNIHRKFERPRLGAISVSTQWCEFGLFFSLPDTDPIF